MNKENDASNNAGKGSFGKRQLVSLSPNNLPKKKRPKVPPEEKKHPRVVKKYCSPYKLRPMPDQPPGVETPSPEKYKPRSPERPNKRKGDNQPSAIKKRKL